MLNPVVLPDPGALFGDYAFAKQSSVIAAVSGGGDSLALLFLLKDFLDTQADAPALTAVTVDHALRPESADEARFVAALCRSHGIAHKTMVWRGEKPATGISASARTARLDLLAQAARDAGAGLIFTGHTQDDQAETVSMRADRGAGRGGAGIAPATLHDGSVWFARPLLGLHRAALRDYLVSRDVRWIDDPTNDNPAYERVRVRKALDAETARKLVHEATDAAAERMALGARAARLIDAHWRCVAPGLYRAETAFLDADDEPALLYALRVLAAMAGGAAQLPAIEPSGRVLLRLRDGFCATLSRAVLDLRSSGLYLHRERRNLPAMDRAAQPLLWDGRYRLGADAGVMIAPFGVLARDCLPETASVTPQDVLFAAQFAEPAFWEGETCLGPARNRMKDGGLRVPAPWAHLLPSFDMVLAQALIRLTGAKTVIALPSADHIQRRGLT